MAVASRPARLAGRGVHEARVQRGRDPSMGYEASRANDRHERYLPPVVDDDASTGRARSRESAAGATKPVPAGCRSRARRGAAGIRAADREVRRAQRAAVSAGRVPGRVELSAPIVLRRPRRRSIPARDLYVLAADVSAPELAG